jgi:ABC-2 type transport system ATP-binding protein
MGSMTAAVIAEDLVKTFGSTRALNGVSLEVSAGSVLGLLGPNGAGKTTVVRLLTTLLKPDSGRVFINGKDALKHPEAVRESIGLSGQFAAVDDNLTGFENLFLVARLYGMNRPDAKARARELLAQFDLTDAADRQAKGYSGGMRRRLDLAGALVAKPKVVILDEPTTGLDPRSRQDTWQVISELVSDGTAVLLTTQYLEEADQLADQIVVIDRGEIIATGTSDDLKSEAGSDRLITVLSDATQLDLAAKILNAVGNGKVRVETQTRRLTVPLTTGTAGLSQVIKLFEDNKIAVLDIGVHRPSMDDVFLALTGHAAEENENPNGS